MGHLIDEALLVDVLSGHIALGDDLDLLLSKLGLDHIQHRRSVGVRL